MLIPVWQVWKWCEAQARAEFSAAWSYWDSILNGG